MTGDRVLMILRRTGTRKRVNWSRGTATRGDSPVGPHPDDKGAPDQTTTLVAGRVSYTAGEAMNYRNTLKAHLKAGRLTEAAEMIWEDFQRPIGKRSAISFFDGMSGTLSEECGVALYGLAAHMIHLYEDEVVAGRHIGSALHDIASALLLTDLCWLPGAEALALHHARRLVELAPNDVSRLEGVLFLYGTPDKVLSDEEAFDFAHRALKLDPKNKRALEVLAKIQARKQNKGE